MQKDSVFKTFLVAFVLCFVCSSVVSVLAVGLKDLQDANKLLDIKKNILLSCGLIKSKKTPKEEIEEVFASVKAKVVDLDTGEYVDDIDPTTYDQEKASKTPGQFKQVDPALNSGIKTRAKLAVVYHAMEGDSVSKIILPIKGSGLWSTLYGFLAVRPDTRTIDGLGFYKHGETAGLGGEIENPMWVAKWPGKLAMDENYKPIFKVVKGSVNPNASNASSSVDGLSGATITSDGVTKLMQYWFGPDGFGPYLEKFRETGS